MLGLDPADIRQHFCHQHGGALVRELYGHFDEYKARERIRASFVQTQTPPAISGVSACATRPGAETAATAHGR